MAGAVIHGILRLVRISENHLPAAYIVPQPFEELSPQIRAILIPLSAFGIAEPKLQ
jgi:hypothetical protein